MICADNCSELPEMCGRWMMKRHILAFIRKYKRLRSLRNRARYGSIGLENRLDISVKILDDAEYQMTAISYVIRNPLAAGLKMAPWHYPWSSSSLYFLKDMITADIGKFLN